MNIKGLFIRYEQFESSDYENKFNISVPRKWLKKYCYENSFNFKNFVQNATKAEIKNMSEKAYRDGVRIYIG